MLMGLTIGHGSEIEIHLLGSWAMDMLSELPNTSSSRYQHLRLVHPPRFRQTVRRRRHRGLLRCTFRLGMFHHRQFDKVLLHYESPRIGKRDDMITSDLKIGQDYNAAHKNPPTENRVSSEFFLIQKIVVVNS